MESISSEITEYIYLDPNNPISIIVNWLELECMGLFNICVDSSQMDLPDLNREKYSVILDDMNSLKLSSKFNKNSRLNFTTDTQLVSAHR